MSVQTLPAEFADLEPFVGWALATEHARTGKRLASSMEDIRAFYDRMSARLEAVMAYLNALPLDALPPEAERLFSDEPVLNGSGQRRGNVPKPSRD